MRKWRSRSWPWRATAMGSLVWKHGQTGWIAFAFLVSLLCCTFHARLMKTGMAKWGKNRVFRIDFEAVSQSFQTPPAYTYARIFRRRKFQGSATFWRGELSRCMDGPKSDWCPESLFLFLSARVSLSLSISVSLSASSLCVSLYLPLYLYLSLSLFLSLSLTLSLPLSLSLSPPPSIFLSLFLFPCICLPISLPINLSVCLSIYLSVYLVSSRSAPSLSLSPYQSVWLSDSKHLCDASF